MSESEIEMLKRQFLEKVPRDGSSVSNPVLRAALGWDLEQYQRIRDELVRETLLQLWRGRGGTVRRANAETAEGDAEPSEKEEKQAVREYQRETKLYPGFLATLKQWAKDQDWTDHIVHQLAHQGRRSTGGTWTRPDFVVLGYRKFEYTPGIVRDVETFEVKLPTCGIDAVFETAAHSRVATKSYLAIHRTSDEPSSDDLDRIESECVRFGIGLVLFSDPKLLDWDYRVEPTRHEPDPFYLEKFIQDQLPQRNQEQMRKWLR